MGLMLPQLCWYCNINYSIEILTHKYLLSKIQYAHTHTHSLIHTSFNSTRPIKIIQQYNTMPTFLGTSQFFGWYLISGDTESKILVFWYFKTAVKNVGVCCKFRQTNETHTIAYSIANYTVIFGILCHCVGCVPFISVTYSFFALETP